MSRKRTPFSANRSPSLVNAALTASGVVATVGQVRLACTSVQIAGQAVDHREEDDVERLLRVTHDTADCGRAGCRACEGKHGSMAPRLAPSLYSSSLV